MNMHLICLVTKFFSSKIKIYLVLQLMKLFRILILHVFNKLFHPKMREPSKIKISSLNKCSGLICTVVIETFQLERWFSMSNPELRTL